MQKNIKMQQHVKTICWLGWIEEIFLEPITYIRDQFRKACKKIIRKSKMRESA